MTASTWAPWFEGKSNTGTPLVGGLLYTYVAGTLTNLATFTDQSGATQNTNPIVLDGSGRANVWLTPGTLYKFVLKTSAGVTVRTVDNFSTADPAQAPAFIASLASTSGASLVGFTQVGAGAMLRTIQDRERDTFHITDFGVKGDGATDDTSNAQSFFTDCETLTKAGFLPRLRYLTGPVQLGNPATATNYSASGQAPGIFCLEGAHRDSTTFIASAAATDKTLLTRRNLAGVTVRGFSVDGQALAATGIDLQWVYQNGIAPSAENILEDLAAFNCKVVGIDLDGMHDSKISGIRTYGSPIGLSLCGGGGQLNLSLSAISGLLRCAAQNLEISQTVALSGLDVNGNTDNRIRITGSQIFPIASVPQTSSAKWGYAIGTQDSGTYGAHLDLDTCFVFGGASGCIVGQFSSFTAKNSVFNWSGGNFFGLISTGSPQAPTFYFEDCEFRGTFSTSPVGVLPTVGNVVLRRCFVSGVYYDYFNTAEEFAITPQIVSASNLAGTGNTYSRQIGRVRITGNVAHHFIDVILATVGSHSGIVMVSGLVASPNEQAVGGGAPIVINAIPLPTNCSQFGLEMQPASDKAALFGFGGTGGVNAATNASALTTGSRIEAVITTRRN